MYDFVVDMSDLWEYQFTRIFPDPAEEWTAAEMEITYSTNPPHENRLTFEMALCTHAIFFDVRNVRLACKGGRSFGIIIG